ncbi:MAG: transposase [Anaerolineaceae bacterium]|nr:MAG: transposase [Anaerolineaceae bacterium]
MARKFRTADYEKTLDLQISLRDVLPPDHLARFIVDVIAQLDLSKIYKQYSDQGAPPYAPEVLLGLLFYAYATGVFSSRKIEKATHEVIPFRFIAGDMHPDHDTVAHFRKQFLAELKELFVQILLIAQAMGRLQLGHVSLDGSKIHADASKSKAVSYKRLLAIEAYLQAEVNELFALAEAADGGQLPDEMNIEEEIARREQQLARLAEAKKVLEARAQARYEAEKAAYEAKMQVREEKTEAKEGRKPPGRPPKPPTPGPRDKDQYNFTDPESRIMKNATNDGFDQHYNTQVVVDHDSRLIVGSWLCNHSNDQEAALPTIDTVPPELGRPQAANLDTGYFSQANINGLQTRGIDPYIATGRSPHHQGWRAYFLDNPDPPPRDASVKEQMAYKLRTKIGNALYRLRKSTVEPVIGIIKEVLGFRQFSLRGLCAAAGEWTLVCLAYNLKRLHTLQVG